MNIKETEAIIEGLLFTAGEPLSAEKISEILGLDINTLKNLMSSMVLSYQNSVRGLIVRELNGSYQLCTRREHGEYILKLFEQRQKQSISPAAYETLAVIAYNQPITKAKIESIRGVNSDSAVNRLIERNLVKEAGKMDAPGKPTLFETTEEFLRAFGLKAVSELANMNLDETNAEEDYVEAL